MFQCDHHHQEAYCMILLKLQCSNTIAINLVVSLHVLSGPYWCMSAALFGTISCASVGNKKKLLWYPSVFVCTIIPLSKHSLYQPSFNITVPARTSDVSGSHLWPPPNIGLKVSLHWWMSKCSSTGKKTPAATLKSLQEIRKRSAFRKLSTYIKQLFPWEVYTWSSIHKMPWFMKPVA